MTQVLLDYPMSPGQCLPWICFLKLINFKALIRVTQIATTGEFAQSCTASEDKGLLSYTFWHLR